MRVLSICAFVSLLVGTAASQESLNVRLVGSIGLPFTVQPTGVAVSGGCAYLSCRVDQPDTQRLIVISVVDPTQPVEVGYCVTPRPAYGVAVAGSYAYLADDNAGLRVISVADPTQPVEVGSCEAFGRAMAVAGDGDFAYVADMDSGGLRIVSVADPSHPVEVGRCLTPAVAGGVAVRGDYAYVEGTSFDVVSVADPTDPTLVGSCAVLGGSCVALSGYYAYVADNRSGLHVIRVADPTHPIEVNTGGSACNGVAVEGNRLYVAAGANGLLVLSLIDPGDPTMVGFYRQPGKDAVAVAVAGDYVYAATEPGGLQAFQYNGEGVEDSRKPRAASRKLATVLVRSLPEGAVAFDAMGRRVLNPTPGLYFVRFEPPADGGRRSEVSKVIVTR